MVLISHTKERVINVNKEKLIVIIPAYEPPREFVDYAATVASLAGALVVVNDGSSGEYDDIFREISEIENVKYISYGENRGKGYALKQAFSYCAETYGEEYVCVTADCDGQHAVTDIYRVAEAAFEHSDALVLGSRNFDLPNVPRKSRVGNRNIRRVFRLLYGLDLDDTQTGLRGFSVKLAELFSAVGGDRFEYEMNVLIYAKQNGICVTEVPIETIYPEDPADHVTHFKAVRDSLRIIGTLVKNLSQYFLSSALSGILDVTVFFLMLAVVLGEKSAINTLIATVTARVASSLLNFTLNKRLVFTGRSKGAMLRYYALWICQLGASYGLVYLFGHVLHLPMTPMKLAGDLVLSAFSYRIQRSWVFRDKPSKEFYGREARVLRFFGRAFFRKYKSRVPVPEEPTVYVCRHLNMRGPLTTIVRLGFHVHPMILSCFFDKSACYKQYSEFTFTERVGVKRRRVNVGAYVASRFVPPLMISLRGIPVHRGEGIGALRTMREAARCLSQGESVIVYPDVDYTAGYEKESEIYDGFLILGQLYRRDTGKSLRFVPLYIDDETGRIREYPHITVDSFKEEREAAREYIKASINGREMRSDD